jgi:effector-binding domain-containing protein
MLTDPEIVGRAEQPYLAIEETVLIPFNATIDRIVPEVIRWMDKNGVRAAGPLLFKYNLVKMPELIMEFGFPVEAGVKGDDRVRAKVLPAGKYLSSVYHGHYDGLEAATGEYLRIARERGLAFDQRATPDGDLFASRVEFYLTDPREERDPAKWQTRILMKLKED